MLPHVSVFGGCCGTDHRHVEQIVLTCKAIAA
jgi:methionine synthase I (cobalamin-dependent)